MAQRRLLLVAASVIAFILTLSIQATALAAPTPQRASAAEAKAAFQRVMAATDRSQVSDRDINLAIAWVTPTTSGTSPVKPMEQGVTPMSGGCTTNYIATWRDNGWGQRLWTYALSQYFCSDGDVITYASTPSAGPTGTLYATWSFAGNTKYSHIMVAAFEPMTERIIEGSRLWRVKKSFAATRRSAIVVKSSQWVTSRRKCRQSISIGLSHGL